ncbi:hypothetical protein HRbin05_00154 [archaeon HR05]|jgi:hypothetical protein|nr:hypothetical protein HRbin05_00154 [archaeon HR05]
MGEWIDGCVGGVKMMAMRRMKEEREKRGRGIS